MEHEEYTSGATATRHPPNHETSVIATQDGSIVIEWAEGHCEVSVRRSPADARQLALKILEVVKDIETNGAAAASRCDEDRSQAATPKTITAMVSVPK